MENGYLGDIITKLHKINKCIKFLEFIIILEQMGSFWLGPGCLYRLYIDWYYRALENMYNGEFYQTKRNQTKENYLFC